MNLPQTLRSRPLRAAAVAALLAGTALAGTGAVQAAPSAAIQPAPMTQRLPDFTQLVQQVKPAVVSITVQIDGQAEDTSSSGPQTGPGGMPFPFPFGFMPQQQAPQHIIGKGSGFFISADGLIVTNNHVVAHAKSVEVTMDDGTKLKAKVIGRDPATDIAVVKVDAGHPVPFLDLGDSAKVMPGEWVIAVGNPYGLSGTVTAGIVSARGRDIGNGPYDRFIQVDAPINRGNSGGPLLDQDGKVVGVNTAIISPSGGSVGIGFAVPSDMVKQVSTEIVKTGHVTRGYLGVSVQPISPAMAKAMRLPPDGTKGALVAGVEADSPAARAGIEPGDVIRSVDGKPITDPRKLAVTAATITPGTAAKVELLRDGKTRTVTVDVGTLHTADAGPGATHQAAHHNLGLALAPLTPDVRSQLGLGPDVKGVAVAAIQPNSPADNAGLQAGDVILGVNGQAVSTPNAVVVAVGKDLRKDSTVALRILRDGQPLFVAVDTKAGSSAG